jgi:hypothetical protein
MFHREFHTPPRAPGAMARPRLAALALLVCALGCGGDRPPGDEAPPSANRAVGRAGEPDTSRSGPAFLAVYRDGPLDELRVVRATDGGLVVAGLCGFPDGTKVTIALLARNPAGDLEAAATVRAVVAEGRFMGSPLAGAAGPPSSGVHVLRLSAAFGPGDQDPAVLASAAGGRRYRGPGMRTLDDGRIVFETLLEAPL